MWSLPSWLSYWRCYILAVHGSGKFIQRAQKQERRRAERGGAAAWITPVVSYNRADWEILVFT